MHRRGTPGRVLALLPLLAAVGACARPPTPAAPQTQPAGQEPHAVAARLLALRQERRHTELRPLLTRDCGAAVVEFLLALDDFADANARLGRWIRDEAGVGLAHTIDQSYLLDDLALYAGPDLGIFSREVELLDIRVADARAFVSYTVPGGLVVHTANLERANGRWQLAASAEKATHLRAAFADMAAGLNELHGELRSGRYPLAQVRDDPDWLMEKTKARLRRGVALLSRPAASSSPATAGAGGS